MAYNSFAQLYDDLMADVIYDNWADFLEKKMKQFNVNGNRILDIGCGTGELAIILANRNFNVTGVDISPEMLSIARNKTREANLAIPLFEQSMSELEGLGEFDVITIFCDSLNYLENLTDVKETFSRAYNHLKPGGLLLFDVHSIYKMEQIFKDNMFSYNDEQISYIWHSYEGEHDYSIVHELTFFVLDEESGRYDRFDEDHFQRTFQTEQYVSLLKETGFSVEEMLADFEQINIVDNSERIFFVAKK